jgi:hypothetical protein
MHVIALVVMLVATAALASAFISQRQRAALVPVRVKRDRR